MSKTKNLFEERIRERDEIHKKLLKKEMRNLEDKLQSKKYNVETLIEQSALGGAYHDLIDSKDNLNSGYQSTFNKTYHTIDVELYKLNKTLDRKTRMIDYKVNDKKEKIFKRIRSEIL